MADTCLAWSKHKRAPLAGDQLANLWLLHTVGILLPSNSDLCLPWPAIKHGTSGLPPLHFPNLEFLALWSLSALGALPARGEWRQSCVCTHTRDGSCWFASSLEGPHTLLWSSRPLSVTWAGFYNQSSHQWKKPIFFLIFDPSWFFFLASFHFCCFKWHKYWNDQHKRMFCASLFMLKPDLDSPDVPPS